MYNYNTNYNTGLISRDKSLLLIKKIFYLFIYFSSILPQSIIINEFLASNTTINPEMYDFDDYSDWIELYNPSNTPYILNDFFLTDNLDNLLKWKIPDNTSIEPGEYLIIWADNYDDSPGQMYTRPYWPWDDFITQHYHTNFKINSDGEQLGLTRADQTGNYILIQEGALWKYLDNGSDQNIIWTQNNFDDTDWNIGNAELGYGDDDEETVLSYGPDASNKYITTYFRHSFNIDNSNELQILTIRLKRDDGAIVYLNGAEVLRSNLPIDSAVSNITYATSAVSGADEDTFFEFNIPSNEIINGLNIIAVAIHQISRTSSDISFDLELIGTSYSNTVLVDSVTFNGQIKDVSLGRDIEDDSWYYFGEPTPGEPNNTMSTNNTDISSIVTSSLESGFYNSPQTIILSTDVESDQIYYTLDGSRPGSSTSLYSEPISIESTTILKARSFDNNKISSRIITATYFINEPIFIPTISLIAEPETLWDPDIGIYENEYKQREIPVTIEYFTQDTEQQFTINAGARLGGLNIWTKPQKPFTIYTRNRFGDEFINYQLFENKQIANFSRIVFRNGGDDWEETLIRDPMTESLARGMMDCGYMAYKPSSLFLNGEYWGIYNIREKFDTQFFSENFNVNPNNIDHLEYTSTQSGTQLMIVEGNSNHYDSMIDYILSNNLDTPNVNAQLNELMNIDSFIDHLVMTLFVANTSWGHNREWWRPRVNTGKWQWLIVDLDRGFNVNNSSINLLDDLIDDYELFQYLLNSQLFRDRFIQRSAAHLNNTFNPTRIAAIVDSLSSTIAMEMPRHIDRWGSEGSISSMNEWSNELDEINQFSQNRQNTVQNQFINELDLDGTVQITVVVEPLGSGYVTINDVPVIYLNEEGNYFKNIPISLMAQPMPGYQFIGWEGVSDSMQINYHCNTDSFFTAVFITSNELILPEIITENTVLTSEHPYTVIQDLIIPSGVLLTINEGVKIKMPQLGNIIVEGQFIVNGTEEIPVEIISQNANENIRWGAICFNNSTDTSIISHMRISGASSGSNPMIHYGAISSINSNIILDYLKVDNVEFPIYVNGGSISISNSSLTSEFICDYINVKSGNALIENCEFFGKDAPDTDAIDLDNVNNGIIRNNRIYDFTGSNSDGIDIGENSENIQIISNKIYHIADKGISVGQNSNINVMKNLFIGCSKGVAVKDSSYAYIVNNSFFNNDTSILCFEKNIGAGGGFADVLNTILSHSNSSSIFADQLSSLNISYSISDTEPIYGMGNLFSNPFFIDPSIYNFELEPNSLCIDSGDPSFQIIENDPINDMGAYYLYNIDDYPFNIPVLDVNIIRINEFLADNQTINTDQNGDFDDWIELYFNLSDTIDLAGYYLTDDFSNPEKWMFPSIEIYGEGQLIIWADDNEDQGNLHTNFKLSALGEEIALYDPDINLIDNISFEEQSIDVSYGRESDGSYYWQFFNSPTPGLTNNSFQLSGDINTDGEVNVIDVIIVVNMILGISTIESSADLNQDGIVNVVDILQIVNIIIVNTNIDATKATISIDGESLNISGNGYIGAIQMTLSHYPNFNINLNKDALVSEYKTDGTTTKLIVVAPKNEKIFTTADSYQIDEVIVTNSHEIIDVTHPYIFKFDQAYPNPFNPITNIDFSIPRDIFVSINIYDLQGRNITTLTEKNYSVGYHSVSWNAEAHSTGLYFVKMIAGDFISSQKIMLVK